MSTIRPARRRLLNFLTALSLLLCVAVVALWLRSYRVGDWIIHTRFWVYRENDPTFDDRVVELSAFSGNGVVRLSWLSYSWGNGFGEHRGRREG